MATKRPKPCRTRQHAAASSPHLDSPTEAAQATHAPRHRVGGVGRAVRSRSPRSIALQEMVVRWQRGALNVNGDLDLFTSEIGRLITDRMSRKMRRHTDVPPIETTRAFEQRISEVEWCDVWQDAFVDVWNHLPKYDPLASAVSTFIYSRVDHVIADTHRAVGKRNECMAKLDHAMDELKKSDPSLRALIG